MEANSKFEEVFRCLKCNIFCEQPHSSTCCGALMCKKCYDLLDNAILFKCVACEEVTKMLPNKYVERMLNIHEAKCVLECGVTYILAEEQNHLKTCKNKLFECNLKDCKFSGKRFEYAAHFKEKHSEYFLLVNENWAGKEDEAKKEVKNAMDMILLDYEEESQIRPLPRTFIRSNIMPSGTSSVLDDTVSEGNILIQSISDN